MTEKRFIVIDVPYENGEPFLYKKMLDKITKKEYDNTLKGIDDMCDLSNKLHEENQLLLKASEKDSELIKTLRKGIHQWKKENEQLKQNINDCFNVILESDYAKKQYYNAIVRILCEENDVDKMTAKQNQRGHEIYYNEIKQEWLYSDNNSPIDVDRPCKKCNHLPTDLGHDYCLKELSNCKFVTNACCGHGINDDAYILLKDGRRFVLDNLNYD